MADGLSSGNSSSFHQPSRKKRLICQYVAAVIVNLSTLVYGTSVAWSSTALPLLKSVETPLNTGPISEDEASWLSSSLYLLALVSTPIFSALSSKISRKKLGYLVAVLHIVSWTLLCVSDLHYMVYVSRVVSGIAAAGTVLFVPIYVSEIAEDSIRGALGCLFLLFINTGILLGFVMGSYMPYFAASGIYLAIPVIFSLLFAILPESPLYLLSNDQSVSASKALKKLRGGKDSDVTEELSHLQSSIQYVSDVTSVKSIWSSKGTIRSLIISIVLCANQQLSGIFAVLNFTVDIFEESGSHISSYTATIIVGILQVFGTCVSCILVERYGRKILLLGSNVTVAFDLGMLGAYFYFKNIGSDVSFISWLPLLCLSLYLVAYSVGLGPMPYVIMTEIFPPQIKSMATSAGLCVVWGCAFLVVIGFKPLVFVVGVHGCFWIFMIPSVAGTIFVLTSVPETKGRSLELILKDINGTSEKKQRRDKPYEEVIAL